MAIPALVLPIIIAACGGQNGDRREIHIVATEHKFTPEVVTVQTGERIRFIIVNEGAEDHEFESDEAQVDEVVIPPGRQRIIEWTAPSTPGELQYICDAPGHFEAGMFGKIIVR